MKTIIIIPARMASQRFPNKPMALIDGIPMIQRVWEKAKLANIGVKFIPPNPPYYLAPKSIDEINDFIVNRILLSLEVINKLPDNYIYNEND